jgi:hypothetical protein
MRIRLQRRHLVEDHLHVFQTRRCGIVHEPSACDGGVVRPVSLRLAEADVDEPVGREIGIERQAEQPTLSATIHRRHAGNGCGHERAVRVHDAQAAGDFLGDQHFAAGQKRDGPGTLQAGNDGRLVESDVRLSLWRPVLTGNCRFLVRRVGGPRIQVGRLRNYGDAQDQEKRADKRISHKGKIIPSTNVSSFVSSVGRRRLRVNRDRRRLVRHDSVRR